MSTRDAASSDHEAVIAERTQAEWDALVAERDRGVELARCVADYIRIDAEYQRRISTSGLQTALDLFKADRG